MNDQPVNRQWKNRMLNALRKFLRFLLNPRLVLCLGIGWMITNGWSYILTALGAFLDIPWMVAVGGAYLSLLWFPFTPEKVITVLIALFLLKRLFPDDTRTLLVLKQELARAKAAIKRIKTEREQKKHQKP